MTGFPYKNVLVIGATSGIGEALATKIVTSGGASVIVAGRRKERLDAFVQKHNNGGDGDGGSGGGSKRVEAAVLDISKLDEIPKFAAELTKAHPDLDCIFLNAGLQRSFDFSKPETVDLSVVENEFQTNYIAYLHLLKAFLPHLQQLGRESSVIFTTSGLALVPSMKVPNYCASKAALHHFILTLREQLKRGGGDVKVIEILPPAVQTELHDYMGGGGAFIGMPLDDFTEQAWAGLIAGEEQIAVGFSKTAVEKVEVGRQQLFALLNAPLANREE